MLFPNCWSIAMLSSKAIIMCQNLHLGTRTYMYDLAQTTTTRPLLTEVDATARLVNPYVRH